MINLFSEKKKEAKKEDMLARLVIDHTNFIPGACQPRTNCNLDHKNKMLSLLSMSLKTLNKF